MSSWAGRTATEIAAAVRERRISPREVVAEHLARIERLDARVGAFRLVRSEAALAEADALAAHPDLARLPLAGVPVAVKDNLPVRGESCRQGSAATPDAAAEEDHVTVARLRAAGAVVVGLTNVPELCVFGTSDSVYGIARNPWDTSRTAGMVPRAAARPPSPPGWCPSRWATTGWGRCASRRPTAAWSG